jgi:replicative DNA helicase
LVDAIRNIMRDEDVAVAIDSLRLSDPEIAKRLVTAAVGVLVNTVNLTSIQDELQRRVVEQN